MQLLQELLLQPVHLVVLGPRVLERQRLLVLELEHLALEARQLALHLRGLLREALGLLEGVLALGDGRRLGPRQLVAELLDQLPLLLLNVANVALDLQRDLVQQLDLDARRRQILQLVPQRPVGLAQPAD